MRVYQASSAEKFGTKGINFRASKAASEAELDAALAALRCGPGETRDP